MGDLDSLDLDRETEHFYEVGNSLSFKENRNRTKSCIT